ncbi:hypothetical protein [Lacinutrix mariniflava]|uniref:hypothetical protein n=1 Tax=Lacinutrix mariniflava TaxID=342955 RepID=UPI0006E2EC3C|nr:hypothetical protein [Lacinutrix mariniflava]
MQYNKHTDAENFAEILKNVVLPSKISIGMFELKGKRMPETSQNYAENENDHFENKHQYIFPLLTGNLEISLRLYENVDNHFRLYCLTHNAINTTDSNWTRLKLDKDGLLDDSQDCN